MKFRVLSIVHILYTNVASFVLLSIERHPTASRLMHSFIPSLYLEPEALHANLVLLDGGKAVLGRIGGAGEEHAFVALRLFLFADATGLWQSRSVNRRLNPSTQSPVRSGSVRCELTLGFSCCVVAGAVAAALVREAVSEKG